MSIFSSYTTTHGPLRASIHAEVGIVFLLRSESNVRIRLLPGSSTLVSSGDQIDARRGRVTVTHFDGSVQTIDGANVTFMAPPSSVSQEPASETPAWLKRLWNHVDQPHSYPNAASVLG